MKVKSFSCFRDGDQSRLNQSLDPASNLTGKDTGCIMAIQSIIGTPRALDITLWADGFHGAVPGVAYSS